MNLSGGSNPTGLAFRSFVIFGFAAPIITFLIALSSLPAEAKIAILAAVAAAYTILFFTTRSKFMPASLVDSTLVNVVAKDDRLAALEEARQSAGSSLKQDEVFELAASRVNEIFPFDAAVLFRPNAGNDSLVAVEVQGGNLEKLLNREYELESCLAGVAFLSADIETDPLLEIDVKALGNFIYDGLRSAAAIPLVYDGRVLAVFEIFTTLPLDDGSLEALLAIQTVITPLFLGAIASEGSISTAFTDAVTELPNQRAFLMVLENQLAQSMRFRDERPLTVLAADLKNFRHVNQQFGHATGDAVLSIAAARIRGQLRKMDFLARFDDDEFAIVMPLVDEKTVKDVIGRIQKAFAESMFGVGELEIPVALHFGTASFWSDGETPQQLIQNAQVRKQRAKAADPGNVVAFRKEYVN